MSTGAYFPRMVTGNIFSEQKLIEVTHSFQWIKDPDYCRAPQKNQHPNQYSIYLRLNNLIWIYVFSQQIVTDSTKLLEKSVTNKQEQS